jgi:hypothetical protein
MFLNKALRDFSMAPNLDVGRGHCSHSPIPGFLLLVHRVHALIDRLTVKFLACLYYCFGTIHRRESSCNCAPFPPHLRLLPRILETCDEMESIC